MNLLSFRDLRLKLGGRSRSSVYRDVQEGRLPGPMKIGHRLYWSEPEIEAWVEARCVRPL
jgi:predicted DNA-binding transcriptional regulator AlpA